MQGVLEERFSFQLFHFSACIYLKVWHGSVSLHKGKPCGWGLEIRGREIEFTSCLPGNQVVQKNGTKLTACKMHVFTYI